jgi:predicted CoA-binding protein
LHDPIQLAHTVKTIALVGASDKPERSSFGVMKFLLARGYSVVPVNPALAGEELLGQAVVASLADITGVIDMVDIFRNTESAAEVIREAIIMKDKLGIKIVWCQLGVLPKVAAAEAEEAGLTVIMDKCPAIEWR